MLKSPGSLTCFSTRDRVDVRGVRGERQVGAGPARLVDQRLDQEMRAIGPFGRQHAVERSEPLLRFLRIDVGLLSMRCPPREPPILCAGARAVLMERRAPGAAAAARKVYRIVEMHFHLRRSRFAPEQEHQHRPSRSCTPKVTKPHAVAAGKRGEQGKDGRAGHDTGESDEAGGAGDRAGRAGGASRATSASCTPFQPIAVAPNTAHCEHRGHRPRGNGRWRARGCTRKRRCRASRARGAASDAGRRAQPQTIRPATPPSVVDRQRQAGGHERAAERFRQVDDEEAHQADLRGGVTRDRSASTRSARATGARARERREYARGRESPAAAARYDRHRALRARPGRLRRRPAPRSPWRRTRCASRAPAPARAEPRPRARRPRARRSA